MVRTTSTIARFLDRVKHAPTQFLSPEIILDACRAVGHRFRRGALDPVHTLMLFLAQILSGNLATSALRHLSPRAFTASAYCQARRRLPLAFFEHLLTAVTGTMLAAADEVAGRWLGHRVVIADGSSFSMPDTPALMKRFGHPAGQKRGCAFPVAHLLLMVDLTTGLIRRALAGPLCSSDLTQGASLLDQLEPGDLFLGDRIFGTWGFFALAFQRRLEAVVRAHGRLNIAFDPRKPASKRGTCVRICELGEGDQIIEWFRPKTRPRWMSKKAYDKLPPSLLLRAIRYTLHGRGFRTVTVTLLTTLVDHQRYPRDAIIDLYRRRWEIETTLRHLKQTMGLRTLRCKTVDGVLKELHVYALAYNLVRLAMLAAGLRQGVDPRRISFVDALRAMNEALRRTLRSAARAPGAPYPGAGAGALLVIPVREGRIEPRAVKRRPPQQRYLTEPRAQARQRLVRQGIAA